MIGRNLLSLRRGGLIAGVGLRRRRGLLAAALAAAWLLLGQPAAARAAGVSVFPIPGSQLASTQTQIAFRGIPSDQLAAATIQVSGSRSGSHSGTIAADSDGNGGSFLPSAPFRAGETVTVSTSLSVLGASNGTFHFRVATPAGVVPPRQRQTVRRVRGDVWRFRSRPDLAPAAVRLLKRSAAAGTADIFLAPQFGPVEYGPEILDSYGNLVWFTRVAKGNVAQDFKVQTYHNQPVLTWWQGYTNAGVGVGEDVIYDSSYRQIAVVKAANGLQADLHEFDLTSRGTALITAYFPVYWDTSSIHGSKKEIVLDSVVQEIDLATGLVLFQWDSLDHVGVGDSYQPLPVQGKQNGFRNPYDYAHLNSIEFDSDGNLVLSARNTWAAYKVNYQTGAIMWTLGGKHSSFRMGKGAAFAFQHDVEIEAPGDSVVTVFDDGGGLPNVHSQSRGLVLVLDVRHMTATLALQDTHSPPLLADFEGNFQPLPGSDAFVGWGQQPYFTQFDRHGQTVLDGRFVDNTSSYRAYRFPWTATPAVPPAVVGSTNKKTTTIYVSWDGATAVAAWRVLGGSTRTGLKLIRTVSKRGFETAINVNATHYVQVQALDYRRNVLGTSGVAHVG